MYGKGKNRKANSPLRGDCFLCFHFYKTLKINELGETMTIFLHLRNLICWK